MEKYCVVPENIIGNSTRNGLNKRFKLIKGNVLKTEVN